MAAGSRLDAATLATIRAATVPGYDRSAVAEGIVHLGVGAFHRAHQAVYVDDCLGAGELDWGITGVSLRSADTRDALAPQDGLYTIAVRSGEGDALRVIGSMKSLLVAPEDTEAVLGRLADPRVRIVTLTVTEKAYMRGADGDLDAGHVDISWDIGNPEKPRTVFGFLAGALARRRAAGVPPFTVLCCDNLPANGETVRRLMLQFAGLAGGDLGAFIEDEVAFPSTMVDRIVPATTDADRERVSEALGVDDAWPVMTEPFMQWVVEENFPTGQAALGKVWRHHGQDVAPFEDMKLRLLNGAHSGIAYLGLLLGHPTVADAFSDPLIRGFVERYWAEVIPTLPGDGGLDTGAYTAALAQRFSNPALRHRTSQIGTDGSQKLPQRIIAPARILARGAMPIGHPMLVAAAWIAACRERGRSLPAGHFTDPLDAKLAEIFAATDEPAELVRAVFAAAGFSGEGGGTLEEVATRHLAIIFEKGVAEAISATARERA